jgi:ATP-dependent DNA helicase RecQ
MKAELTRPMQDLSALLRSVFGFDGFRPGQQEIVEAILAGRDVLAIMPTGGGKSLCFQLPALARETGVTVVISPLIALMRDQVAALLSAGVSAGALTSNNTPEENERVHAELEAGTLRLLYLAPERLPYVGGLLRRIGVNMIAVDEAHCVSQWGHDFRPDYLRIGDLRDALGDVQITAFTATADEETREEISRRLFRDPPAVFLHGFDRPNLFLAFEPKISPRQQLMTFVKARKGQAGIVYCSSRNKTEVLAKAISDAGIPALAYHAGLQAEVRSNVQDRFQREDDLVICATVAFGMGVDKPDIRWVAHADLPKSMEAYYQEIGRAGRDGAPADTLTLYGDDDFRLQRARIDESPSPAERKRADYERLDALLRLAEATKCRRENLLRYFGDDFHGPCGGCDLCRTPPELFDGTEAAQKALSAIYRTDEMFGAGHVIKVLRGEKDDRTRKFGHENLSVFGIGKEHSAAEWKAILRQLHALGMVRVTEKLGWALTDIARPVLRGEAKLELRRDTIRAAASAGTSVGPRGARGAAPAMLSEEDEPLFNALRGLRRRLAERQGVPAYVIFVDRTLIEMAQKRPATLDDLAQCSGVGATKLTKYGAEFLAEINGGPSPTEPKSRIRAASRGDGPLYDALREAQITLARGADGTGKPLSCTNATLAKIAETRPVDLIAIANVKGMSAAKAERFGDTFLRLIEDLSDA